MKNREPLKTWKRVKLDSLYPVRMTAFRAKSDELQIKTPTHFHLSYPGFIFLISDFLFSYKDRQRLPTRQELDKAALQYAF